MSLVVSFAGQIGSGKSSVSQSIATEMGWPCAVFSNYLRQIAKEQGKDSNSREILQDLGQTLVKADSREFCRAVLLDGGFSKDANMLVDGVRHVNIQRDIETLVAPASCKLIYLSAGNAERFTRVTHRLDGPRDFERAESHIVESELRDELPAIADVIIDAERDLHTVIAECRLHIRAWLQQS